MMQGDFEKLRVGEVFKSRKNRVFRVIYGGNIRVAKVYPIANAETAQLEFDILVKSSRLGLRVPKPVELVGSTLVMAYVEGVNLADSADLLLAGDGASTTRDPAPLDSITGGLADWLASFHKAFGLELCRGDTILRNFLCPDGRVLGLDFEEARTGDPISDVGELCSNILGMRPLFGARNAQMASAIVSRYWTAVGKDRSTELPEAIALGLEHYAKFRDDGKLLEKWAQKFRKEGSGLLEEIATDS